LIGPDDHISGAFNDVIRKCDAIDKLMGDAWIEALLSLYKTITEGLLTIIAAPVIAGFRHVYGLKTLADGGSSHWEWMPLRRAGTAVDN
jgi:hypothetical protein